LALWRLAWFNLGQQASTIGSGMKCLRHPKVSLVLRGQISRSGAETISPPFGFGWSKNPLRPPETGPRPSPRNHILATQSTHHSGKKTLAPFPSVAQAWAQELLAEPVDCGLGGSRVGGLSAGLGRSRSWKKASRHPPPLSRWCEKDPPLGTTAPEGKHLRGWGHRGHDRIIASRKGTGFILHYFLMSGAFLLGLHSAQAMALGSGGPQVPVVGARPLCSRWGGGRGQGGGSEGIIGGRDHSEESSGIYKLISKKFTNATETSKGECRN